MQIFVSRPVPAARLLFEPAATLHILSHHKAAKLAYLEWLVFTAKARLPAHAFAACIWACCAALDVGHGWVLPRNRAKRRTTTRPWC